MTKYDALAEVPVNFKSKICVQPQLKIIRAFPFEDDDGGDGEVARVEECTKIGQGEKRSGVKIGRE